MRTKLFIPARMGSSRFPGKPLYKIKDKPMLQWVYDASIKSNADEVYVTSPDPEILDYCKQKNIPCVLTSIAHERCLDRVGEAAELTDSHPDDIIVCMQGDEPLVHETIINSIIAHHNNSDFKFLVGCLPIDEREYHDRNIVKVAYDNNFKTIYTSRSPIPNGPNGHKDSVRIFGLFSFDYEALQLFNRIPVSRLEVIETCDTNRILGTELDQHVCILPCQYRQQSVDCIEDISIVLSIIDTAP